MTKATSISWGARTSSSSPEASESAPRRSRAASSPRSSRSEEHTSELQSQSNLVCRLLLEKKKKLTLFTDHRHIASDLVICSSSSHHTYYAESMFRDSLTPDISQSRYISTEVTSMLPTESS